MITDKNESVHLLLLLQMIFNCNNINKKGIFKIEYPNIEWKAYHTAGSKTLKLRMRPSL